MKYSPAFDALVKAAKSNVTETSISEVADRLMNSVASSSFASALPTGFHVVDIREDHEFASGHIPGAIHLGRGILERDVEARIPDCGAEIILVCGGGGRSALSAESLQKMGYTRVRSMAGGMRSWKEAGHAIEMPEATHEAATTRGSV